MNHAKVRSFLFDKGSTMSANLSENQVIYFIDASASNMHCASAKFNYADGKNKASIEAIMNEVSGIYDEERHLGYARIFTWQIEDNEFFITFVSRDIGVLVRSVVKFMQLLKEILLESGYDCVETIYKRKQG